MIVAWLIRLRGWLSIIPWQAWVAIALAGAFYLYGEHKFNAGKRVVIERLEEAQAKAEAKAAVARSKADKAAQHRAEEFEAQQDLLEKVIDDAQDNGGNALDSLFGGLSEAD